LKHYYPYSVILWLLLCGCGSEMVNVVSYELNRTDFIEKFDTKGTIQATNTLTVTAPRLRVSNMTVIYLAGDGAHVSKGDTICILDAPSLIEQYESAASRLEQVKMDLNKLIIENEVSLSSLRAQLDNMEIRIALNSLDSIQKQFAPPVQQRLFALELEKANVERTKLQKRYAAQKQIYEAEKKGLNSRIFSTENDIQRVVDQINQLTITAPQDGMTLHTTVPLMRFMSMSGIGSVGGKIAVNSSVFSNMALLQMPDLRQMEVSVEVPETKYRRILAGQKVNIQIDALANVVTTGEVKRKTLVAKTPDSQTAVKLYEVIVSIDSLHNLMTPGLSATCEIIVNEVRDTVVVPTLAVFDRDSLKIIYVADNGRFIPVPVETGLSNSTETIISKGLNGSETIALVEPSGRLIDRSAYRSGHLSDPNDPADSVNLHNDTVVSQEPAADGDGPGE
jgi:HlyD family secretion protein